MILSVQENVRSGGVDEVRVPGQVASLRKRIELLEPVRAKLLKDLAPLASEAPKASLTVAERAAMESRTRQANRLKVQLASVDQEIETLNSLVAARLAQSAR
ncbi:MAG: hypothetical protein ACYDGR_09650 [Candidatus Dormibacteria bacterium]